MNAVSKENVSVRIWVRVVLVLLLAGSGGASALPGLLSQEPVAVGPHAPAGAGRVDLVVRANGEVILYREPTSQGVP